jgi:8-oxo-dGTP pyrophosphatase MutT (NUDIX family)
VQDLLAADDPGPRVAKPWSVKKTRYLVERWWMRLREDHVVLPNGDEIDEFHVLEYPDWACVVCLTADHDVVLVRQYRHAVVSDALELPAGTIERGEPALEAAKRELLEETGFAGSNWKELGWYYQDPSRQTNRAFIFCTSGAKRVSDPTPDRNEQLETVLVPANQIVDLMASARVNHAVHVLALRTAQVQGLFRVE